MRKVAVVLLLLPLMVLSACAKKASDTVTYSETPEDAIQRAFDLCRAGKYDEAVRLYTNGSGLFESDPASAKSMVDRACVTYSGTATRYEILHKTERGDGAEARVDLHVFAADDPKSKLEYNPWTVTLIKNSQGWLIAN
jgi:hypothetical protein